MITVEGMAKLNVNYKVELNMAEEEFDELSESGQTELLENAIDWKEACRSAETDGIDVWEVEEIK